jgi:hypothetical protein
VASSENLPEQALADAELKMASLPDQLERVLAKPDYPTRLSINHHRFQQASGSLSPQATIALQGHDGP